MSKRMLKGGLTMMVALCMLSVSVVAQDAKIAQAGFSMDEATLSNARRIRDEKLKADVGKLVSDTKEGKHKLSGSTAQTRSTHHFSKTAKIAIVAGVGIAVLAIIASHQKKHIFDGFNINPLGN